MCDKRKKIKKKTKTEKLSQFLGSRISRVSVKRFRSNLECGVLKLKGMSTAKIVLFHQGSTELATEVRKLRFLSSCQYTHGCCAPASWAARHTTVCLDYLFKCASFFFHFLRHRIPLKRFSFNYEVVLQKGCGYQGVFTQCICTFNFTKSCLLVYEIAFVLFEDSNLPP